MELIHEVYDLALRKELALVEAKQGALRLRDDEMLGNKGTDADDMKGSLALDVSANLLRHAVRVSEDELSEALWRDA